MFNIVSKAHLLSSLQDVFFTLASVFSAAVHWQKLWENILMLRKIGTPCIFYKFSYDFCQFMYYGHADKKQSTQTLWNTLAMC